MSATQTISVDQSVAVEETLADDQVTSTAGNAPRRVKRGVRAAGVSVLLALLFTPFLQDSAGASTYYARTDYAGTVWTPGPMITAWESSIPGMYGTRFYTKNFNVGSVSVGRSAFSYSQYVAVVSEVQRSIGSSWITVQSQTRWATVSGNGTATFRGWTWSPTNVPNNRFYYRVVHQIFWFDYSTDQLVALTGIVPNGYGDSACSARSLPCATASDSVYF